MIEVRDKEEKINSLKNEINFFLNYQKLDSD